MCRGGCELDAKFVKERLAERVIPRLNIHLRVANIFHSKRHVEIAFGMMHALHASIVILLEFDKITPKEIGDILNSIEYRNEEQRQMYHRMYMMNEAGVFD